jgi:hypothetical protein
MSYRPNTIELHRHAAVYVDKILKGRRPSDLPVHGRHALQQIAILLDHPVGASEQPRSWCNAKRFRSFQIDD